MGLVSRAGLTQRHLSIASASGHMRTLSFQPVKKCLMVCCRGMPALDEVSVTHTEVPTESIKGHTVGALSVWSGHRGELEEIQIWQ